MRLNIFGFGSGAKDATAAQSNPAAALGAQDSTSSSGLQDVFGKPASRKGAQTTTGTKTPSGKSKGPSKAKVQPPTNDSLKKRVKWLLTSLDALKQRIEPALEAGDTQKFVEAMGDYLSFITSYNDEVAYDTFEIGPAFPEYHEFFLRATLELAWRMEEKAFDEIMEATLEPWQKMKDVVSTCVRGAYTRMEELPSLVDFSQFRSIVMLGCGKVPSGLFYLYDQTPIPAIVGIDNLPQAVDDSNALLRKFNLDRVRVIEADATTLDYSYFDAIYFGPFATPRKDVMKRIRATARPNATVILRDPVLTGSLGLEKVLPYMEPAFTLLRSGDATKYRGRFMLRHHILKVR
jgi:hypothetical protein